MCEGWQGSEPCSISGKLKLAGLQLTRLAVPYTWSCIGCRTAGTAPDSFRSSDSPVCGSWSGPWACHRHSSQCIAIHHLQQTCNRLELDKISHHNALWWPYLWLNWGDESTEWSRTFIPVSIDRPWRACSRQASMMNFMTAANYWVKVMWPNRCRCGAKLTHGDDDVTGILISIYGI